MEGEEVGKNLKIKLIFFYLNVLKLCVFLISMFDGLLHESNLNVGVSIWFLFKRAETSGLAGTVLFIQR